MRILQVISSLDSRGGGPIEGLIQQGYQLQALGHDVHTLSLDKPGATIDPRMAERSIHFAGPRIGVYAYAPRLASWLRQHIQEYDCILIHGMWQYHGYCVAKVCREQKIPYVIFLHGMLDPWFNRRYPLKRIKKWLYWPWVEYRILRDARYVLFTTTEEMRLARDSFWLYRVRERFVGYGIQDRDIPIGSASGKFIDRFPDLKNKRIILYLSRLHPKKGCDMLLNAFAKVADSDSALHLVLAGPGDDGWVGQLKQQVDILHLQGRVSFPGMLSGEMKWGAYDAAEVFILPSHQENFGIVLAEALASGLPVLTTRQVNIWRPIEYENAGLIESNTPEGTILLLQRWLNLRPMQRVEMRSAALACFKANFEINRAINQLEQSLKDAVSTDVSSNYSFVGRFWRRGEYQP